MSNLIQSVGPDYFNRRFTGSYFLDDRRRPSIVGHTQGDVVVYTALTGSPTRVISTERTLPHNFFTGLEVFSVPPLGWRSHSKGMFLSFFSRNNRSYHRGLSQSNLVQQPSDLTRWLMRSGNFDARLNNHNLCLMALKPSFIPFTEGVQKMREGELLSFAVSPVIAVMPDEDDKFSIYFRQRKAGVVMPDNTVVVDVPILADYVGGNK